MMDEKKIEKLEEAGGNRWQKYGKDRIYFGAETIGLVVDYYKSGNVSSAEWQGEKVSNADARRILSSKVWVDCEDGSVHVTSSFRHGDDDGMSVEDIAKAFIEGILEDEESEEDTEEEDTGMNTTYTITLEKTDSTRGDGFELIGSWKEASFDSLDEAKAAFAEYDPEDEWKTEHDVRGMRMHEEWHYFLEDEEGNGYGEKHYGADEFYAED